MKGKVNNKFIFRFIFGSLIGLFALGIYYFIKNTNEGFQNDKLYEERTIEPTDTIERTIEPSDTIERTTPKPTPTIKTKPISNPNQTISPKTSSTSVVPVPLQGLAQVAPRPAPRRGEAPRPAAAPAAAPAAPAAAAPAARSASAAPAARSAPAAQKVAKPPNIRRVNVEGFNIQLKNRFIDFTKPFYTIPYEYSPIL